MLGVALALEGSSADQVSVRVWSTQRDDLSILSVV